MSSKVLLHQKHLPQLKTETEIVERTVRIPCTGTNYGLVFKQSTQVYVRKCQPSAENQQCEWESIYPHEVPSYKVGNPVEVRFRDGQRWRGEVTELFKTHEGKFQWITIRFKVPVNGAIAHNFFAGDQAIFPLSRRGYYRFSVSLPDQIRERQSEVIALQFYNPDPGCGTFHVVWNILPGMGTCPSLQVTSTVWKLLPNVPDVFEVISKMDDKVTPEEFCAALEHIGFCAETPSGERVK